MAILQRALARRRWQALCSRSSVQAFAARSVSHAAESAPRPLFHDDGGESLKAGWLSKEDGAVARYLKLREGSALRQAGEHVAEGKKLQGVKEAGGQNTPRHPSDNVFENVCKDRVFSLLDEIRVAQRTRSVNSVSEDLQELVNAKLKHWHGKVDGIAAMRILQRLDRNISLAQCFYHWIRSQPGFKVHPSHVGVLINIAGRAKEFAVMEEYLKDYFSLTGKPPNVIEFTNVMKSYADAQRIDSMLTVYRKMLAEGVAPDTHTFSILIRALVQARQPLEAAEIFRSMKKFNCVPNEFVCNEMVGLFGSIEQLSKAEAMLEEMSSGGVPLNSVVYNNLISQYCKVNEAEKALNLFHQMVERDIRPNPATIFLLTDCFFKDRVFSLLDEIRVAQRTRSVNIVSEDLQELVNAKLKYWHGKVDGIAAMRILQRLDRNISLAQCFYHWFRSQPGFKVRPSHVGVLINIAGRAKEFAVMEEYLKNFFSLTGKPPDVVEFTNVMKSYADAQRIDSMLTVYRKMLAEGVAPGTLTFSLLIRALVQAERPLEATEIFRSMKKFNCVPNEFVCSEMVGLFGSMKQLSKAEALLEEMSSGGVPLNSVVYNNLISQYCKVNEAEKALNLFHQMVERGIRPDSATILLLTDFFFKRNQWEMVDVLMNEAERLGIELSRVRMYWHVRQGRLSEAEKELSLMKSIGKVHGKACLTLLHGYVKEGLFDSAKSLLETLRDEGGGVDSLAYAMLMTFCLECNTKEGCRTLVDCMEASQHWWHETLTGLIVPKQGIYEEDALWKEVESNLCKLRSEKTEVGNQMVGITVAFLEKSDSSKRAMRFWKEARRLGFYRTVQSRKKDVQDIDLHFLHPLAVKPVLACELSSFHKDLSDIDTCISEVRIVTGWGRSIQHEGRDSSVKNEVRTILKELNSPFKDERGNRGAVSAKTAAVSNWLQLNRTKSFFLLQD